MKSVWGDEQEDEYAVGAIQCTCAFALKHLQPTLSQAEALEKAKQLWLQRDIGFFN